MSSNAQGGAKRGPSPVPSKDNVPKLVRPKSDNSDHTDHPSEEGDSMSTIETTSTESVEFDDEDQPSDEETGVPIAEPHDSPRHVVREGDEGNEGEIREANQEANPGGNPGENEGRN